MNINMQGAVAPFGEAPAQPPMPLSGSNYAEARRSSAQTGLNPARDVSSIV